MGNQVREFWVNLKNLGMLKFRRATIDDVELLFNWVNDPLVRNNSYQKEMIIYENHVKWFSTQINNDTNYLYVFLNESNLPVGQVRINKNGKDNAIIGLMIDSKFRGNGFAKEMITKASDDFLCLNSSFTILAYIFKSNTSSLKSFLNAGYILLKEEIINKIDSYILYKEKNEKRY